MKLSLRFFTPKITPIHMMKHDRRRLADKFMELGNIGAGILVFNQVIESEKINSFAFISGIILLIISYASGIILVNKKI
jgi:hypothetical protein